VGPKCLCQNLDGGGGSFAGGELWFFPPVSLSATPYRVDKIIVSSSTPGKERIKLS